MLIASGTRFFWYQILAPIGADRLPVLFYADFWYARVHYGDR